MILLAFVSFGKKFDSVLLYGSVGWVGEGFSVGVILETFLGRVTGSVTGVGGAVVVSGSDASRSIHL